MTKVGVLGDSFECTSFVTPKDARLLNEQIVSTIKSLTSRLDGVGIACPGAASKGLVKFMPNLPIGEYDGRAIGEALGVPFVVTNDGNAAALGESIYGGYSDSVMLTLGTGVGGGIVMGGKLYEGYEGYAGELGHMIVCAGGRECGCGMRGCLEAYVSATALIRRTAEEMKKCPDSLMWRFAGIEDVNARIAIEAEKLGDEAAGRVIDEYLNYLTVGIINICNIFRPRAIILGGGISNWEALPYRLKERCEKLEYGYKFAPKPHIIRAKLGSYAGMYGAIELIKNKVEEKIL